MPEMARNNRGWLEEDQNGMIVGSSNTKGWLVEDQNQWEIGPKIFKLNIDCFDEIFEYLSLRDLHSFGQTCKTMLKVTGEYFKRNYSAALLHMEDHLPQTIISGGIYLKLSSAFNQILPRIHFEFYNKPPLRYFSLHKDKFQEIKHLSFTLYQIDEKVVNTINGIFPKLESIQVHSVKVKENFYDIMLKFCGNLKRIHLTDVEYDFENHQEIPGSWIKQKYPNLEHLELAPILSIDDMNVFFENNPNVQSFTTTAGGIWKYRNEILKFKVKLDLLTAERLDYIRRNNLMVPFCALLNQLHGQGFFNRLCIEFNEIDENSSVALASLHGLEKLKISFHPFFSNIRTIHLPSLPSLKELEFSDETQTVDIKVIATKFMNLEQLIIYGAKHEDILSFIQMPKLKILKLEYEEKNKKINILKLLTLNKEREKLPRARKVTIYVPDFVFLKTKWNVGNGETNLPLIQMKRIDSYEWNNYYDWT